MADGNTGQRYWDVGLLQDRVLLDLVIVAHNLDKHGLLGVRVVRYSHTCQRDARMNKVIYFI